MIAVIGLGVVGLTTALGFAYKGYTVYGFDIDQKRSGNLKRGIIPFQDDSALEKNLKKYKNKRFFICEKIDDAVLNSDLIFYCVGTPNRRDRKVDLRFLKNAINASLRLINKERKYKVLVIKSSVPPTTTEEIIKPLITTSKIKLGDEIGLIYNPEFLREGSAWHDFIRPDRIIIGENDKRSGDRIEKIYKSFNAPIFRVSLTTAEFAKYLSNLLLSNLISFSNEMAMIADRVGGIDIRTSFKILHFDERWRGKPASMINYVYPGCGFGGYCLPKDTQAMYSLARAKGCDIDMLNSILVVNKKVKRHFVTTISKTLNHDTIIGILGLSFKPNCDDVRGTPAREIIEMLLKKGFKKIIAYDPKAMGNFKEKFNLPIQYAKSVKELMQRCNVTILLTAWKEFKRLKNVITKKRIIDGRYFL